MAAAVERLAESLDARVEGVAAALVGWCKGCTVFVVAAGWACAKLESTGWEAPLDMMEHCAMASTLEVGIALATFVGYPPSHHPDPRE